MTLTTARPAPTLWRASARAQDAGPDTALRQLEDALARGVEDTTAHAARVTDEIDRQRAPGGLLAEVLEADPALACRVEAVRDLQDEVVRGLGERSSRRELLRAVRALRRAEERLLLDAFWLDLGGEGA